MARIKIKPWYWRSNYATAPGTFWSYAGGWVTAAHVFEEMDNHRPPFVQGTTLVRPGIALDAALFGIHDFKEPPKVRVGMRVKIWGYPLGCSRCFETRTGKIWAYNDADALWTVQIDDDQLPVVVGMSGGLVATKVAGKFEPIGIVSTRNHEADLDFDGDDDESCGFTSLHDVWTSLAPNRGDLL